MSAINLPDARCTVARLENATAQLSLKQLAWRALSPSVVADVAHVAPVAGVAVVANRPLYELRLALLALADRHGFRVAHIHRLQDPDVAACAGLDDSQLVAYLALLEDSATRWAGKRPVGHDAAVLCHHCGPVWVHPTVAAVLPIVGGWPRALGCPWCAIRKAGAYIPRPPVWCEDCGDHQPDPINPEAALGQCARGKGPHYPMQKHACDAFSPSSES